MFFIENVLGILFLFLLSEFSYKIDRNVNIWKIFYNCVVCSLEYRRGSIFLQFVLIHLCSLGNGGDKGSSKMAKINVKRECIMLLQQMIKNHYMRINKGGIEET